MVERTHQTADEQAGDKPGTPPKRRTVLRDLATGIATGVGITGVTAANSTDSKGPTAVEVESLDFEVNSALEKFDNVIDSPLFERLVSEGYISEKSTSELPSHKLSDDTKRGGVTWLRINGEIEQINVHKDVDGDRLEINLPLSNSMPKAVLYREDGSSIIYEYQNGFQGEEVETSDHCGGWRYCVTCWGCCPNWSYNEQQVECPGCWIGHCQWVKVSCC